MRLLCRHCKRTVIRYKWEVMPRLTKRGLKSFCHKTQKPVYLTVKK
jgi:hypothetical protein